MNSLKSANLVDVTRRLGDSQHQPKRRTHEGLNILKTRTNEGLRRKAADRRQVKRQLKGIFSCLRKTNIKSKVAKI